MSGLTQGRTRRGPASVRAEPAAEPPREVKICTAARGLHRATHMRTRRAPHRLRYARPGRAG